MELQDVVVSDSRAGSIESLTHHGDRLHPHHPSTHPPRHHSRSPSLRMHSPIMHRSPSPRRHRHDHHGYYHEGPGFSDTVSNVVEIQRHHHHPHSSQYSRHRIRGPWSASTSPARSPSPVHRIEHGQYYGTTSLEQRSRSPSPIGGRTTAHPHHHHRHPSHQHSYPVLVQRRGRRLPPTPNKPSTLQLKPANINFPKLNASPTHGPHMVGGPHVAAAPVPGMPHPPTGHIPPPVQPTHCPLSFEQAVAMGRGGRLLPSPVPNGYKPQPQPKQQRIPRSRHSDSDEDDWC